MRDSQVSSLNGKLNEYNAAVGLAVLDGWTERRRDLAERIQAYRTQLADARFGGFVGFPDVDLSYPLLLCNTERDAKSVVAALSGANIGYRFWYGEGLHKQTYFKKCERTLVPVSEDIARRAIGLPMAPDLELTDIKRISEVVLSALPTPPI